MTDIQGYTSFDTLPIRVLGRTGSAGGAPVLWHTGSGFVCRYTGSALWLRVAADYAQYEPWLAVEVNGAWLQRFPLPRGESEVCLFRGMTAGTVKQVRVLKECQAMPDDPTHSVRLLGLRWPDEDAGFLSLPEPKYRLEFIGDSITSGEGLAGAQSETDWLPMFFSAVPHYARLTADALGAEYRIFSQSGWGLCSSWDNDPRHVVMDDYATVCGQCGDTAPYDFAAWPADAVILNLGTNDWGAMHEPAWRDPVTGRCFQQADTPEGHARISKAVAKALHTVRRCNPNALLIWAFGMLGDELRPTLEAGIRQYKTETGDTRVFYLPLPAAVPATMGAREHPGPACHRQAAEVLTAFLKDHL